MQYFPLYSVITTITSNFKIALLGSTATVLMGIATVVLLHDTLRVKYDRYLLVPLLALFGWYSVQLLHGFLNGYEPILALGDFSKIFVLIIVFLIVGSLDRSATEESLRYLAIFGTVGVVVQFVLFLLSGTPEFRLWTVMLVPIFLFSHETVSSDKIRNGIILLLIAMIVLGGMRTQWVGLAVLLSFYLLVTNLTDDGQRIGWQTFVIAMPAIVAMLAVMPQFGSHIYLEITSLISGGQSVQARVVEYQAVIGYILSRSIENPLVLLFGFGLGAEYPVTSQLASVRGLTDATHHFIHNAFIAILLRTGLIGLGLFSVVLLRASKISYLDRTPAAIVLFATLLVLVTVSIVSPFMKMLPYVIITGYVLASLNNLSKHDDEAVGSPGGINN